MYAVVEILYSLTEQVSAGVFFFFFSDPVLTVGQGFGSPPTSSASSIIDACKMLLFYLQQGGSEQWLRWLVEGYS